jgi:hypothetical protein
MYMLLGVLASMGVSLGLTEAQAARVAEAVRGELGSFARLLPGLAAEPPQAPRRSILGIKLPSKAAVVPRPAEEGAAG